MTLKEVGVKLTIKGGEFYRRELQEINREIRLLQIQSKLAAAQLGNNAKSTDVFKTRVSGLSKEIQITSEKVDSYKKRFKELPGIQKELSSTIENTTKAYKESVVETERLGKSHKFLETMYDKNHEMAKKTKQEWNESKKITKELADEIKKLENAYKENSVELESLPKNLSTAELATQNKKKTVEQLKKEYLELGGVSSETVKKLSGFSESLMNKGFSNIAIGSQLTNKFTLPIMNGFKYGIEAAGQFNTEVGKLGPLLSNGGPITANIRAEVDKLGSSSREWAISYGKNTSEINEGMSELIRHGYTSNQVMGMMPNLLDASLASGESFNAVMGTSSQVLNQFKLKGESAQETLKNTARVTDSLTYIANKTSSGFTDLGVGMAYVGPLAQSVNMSVEETASVLGLLSNKGIEAAQGGTALRETLSRLLNPSKQNAEAMAEMGFSADEFQKGTIQLPDIIDRIRENTKGWTDEQRASAIVTAFGTEAQMAMNALVEEGGDSLRYMTSETESASGATKQIADSMKELPEFKYQEMMAQVRDLGIELGQELLPVAMDVMGAIKDLAKWFSELDDGTQDLIIKSGLIVSALGPVLTAFGTAQTLISDATGALKNFVSNAGKKKGVEELGTAALGMGDDVVAGATKAGGAAALFSNPWVWAGAAAVGALAGIVWYVDKEMKKPFEDHDKSVEVTEGKYKNWYDEVIKGSKTAVDANTDVKKSVEEVGQAVKKETDKLLKQNSEVRDAIDQQLNKGWARVEIEGEKILSYANGLQKQLSDIGMDKETYEALLAQYDGLATTIGTTFTHLGNMYVEHQVINADGTSYHTSNERCH